MALVALISTALALFLAGVAGLGLGIGVVVGAAIVRAVRRPEPPTPPPGVDDGKHRA